MVLPMKVAWERSVDQACGPGAVPLVLRTRLADFPTCRRELEI